MNKYETDVDKCDAIVIWSFFLFLFFCILFYFFNQDTNSQNSLERTDPDITSRLFSTSLQHCATFQCDSFFSLNSTIFWAQNYPILSIDLFNFFKYSWSFYFNYLKGKKKKKKKETMLWKTGAIGNWKFTHESAR